jgi:ligand-binding sensor domain-containing protein
VWRAPALDPLASDYLRTDFSVEQGLPDDEVNAIAQTPNGFLWVGTDSGLIYVPATAVNHFRW